MKKIIAVILAVALFFAVVSVSAVVTLNSVSVSADGTVAQLEAFGNIWEKGIIDNFIE